MFRNNPLQRFMQSNHPRHLLGIFTLLLLTTVAFAESASQYALYRSEDHSQSWTRTDFGLPRNARINALAASAENFIAGTDAGIFISTNAAQSWQPVAQTSQSRSNRVTSLATLDQHAFAGTIDGLLTSSDRGNSWQRSPSFPNHLIRSLHVLDGSIYVGTDAHQVYQSSDRGQTWTHLAAGLPPLSQVFALTSLNGRLFAGLYAKGLYTWDPDQKKWLRLGATAKIAPLALATIENTLIAGHNPGGIHRSEDLGHTWRPWSLAASGSILDSATFSLLDSTTVQTARGTLPALEAPIWEMSAGSKIAIAGAGNGIFYSTDRARTWTRATNGLPTQSSGIAFLISGNLILAAIHQSSSL
jgi:photosystem II stability/assembly factor-like uncharacterized protein